MDGEARAITFYYPKREHMSLSVTGPHCALGCRHCGGKYLESMMDVSTPEKFRQVLGNLRRTGIKGILLSGGCNADGCVPFFHLTEVIKEAVREGYFRINVHTGIVDREGARELMGTGIENICLDVVGTGEVIEEVYGLQRTDPGASLDALLKAGFRDIIPHITAGLLGGKLSHEEAALSLVRDKIGEPAKIVLLSLIPTRGTCYENAEKVDRREMVGIISTARKMFPGTELILGCMRPHYEAGEIVDMVKAGLDGIVNPPEEVGRELRENGGSDVVEKAFCCSF